jgi:hypothetical protein
VASWRFFPPPRNAPAPPAQNFVQVTHVFPVPIATLLLGQ